jgi:hypothetical protein
MRVSGQLGEGMPQDAGHAYVVLGEIFELLDEPERTIKIYELAIEKLEALPSSRHLLIAQRRLAAVLDKVDCPDVALGALRKALGVQEHLNAPSD